MTNQENKEAEILVLQEPEETMVELRKLTKKLTIYSREGVSLINYETVQATYLRLKHMKTVVIDKMDDWIDFLSQDE